MVRHLRNRYLSHIGEELRIKLIFWCSASWFSPFPPENALLTQLKVPAPESGLRSFHLSCVKISVWSPIDGGTLQVLQIINKLYNLKYFLAKSPGIFSIPNGLQIFETVYWLWSTPRRMFKLSEIKSILDFSFSFFIPKEVGRKTKQKFPVFWCKSYKNPNTLLLAIRFKQVII